ncbi:hypothetical protein RBSWK_02061 [Rhodopirellula baltica SWK14]|uniref:Uncharacterized protein n=1 Tax=Rhodopirellula baltica SWK14 TaxID=993516 RepID=L7CJC3_RHOBT|nr:hypothetical protein RBSWK_02061 [Rhodopirellula baltica SWK14]
MGTQSLEHSLDCDSEAKPTYEQADSPCLSATRRHEVIQPLNKMGLAIDFASQTPLTPKTGLRWLNMV